MMRFNGFIPAALAVTVGILAIGASLLWQRAAAAKSSDNANDVQKAAKPASNDDQPKPREAKIV